MTPAGYLIGRVVTTSARIPALDQSESCINVYVSVSLVICVNIGIWKQAKQVKT